MIRALVSGATGMAVLSCAPARQPAPTTPAPVPSAPRPAAPVAEAWSFAWTPGVARYEVKTISIVELKDDTSRARDSLTTIARLGLRLAATNGRLRVSGTVDSFLVSTMGRVPPAPNDTAGRKPGDPLLTFRGTLDASGLELEQAEHAANCDSPAAALLALASDMLPPVPRGLTRGQRWTDTTITAICRGDIPVSTQAIHAYEVTGPRNAADGRPAIEVRRTSTISLTGTGAQRGQAVTITGSGTADRTMLLDVAGGRLLHSEGQSFSTVSIANDIKTMRFEQRARTTIDLIGDR
jgi:hypothetical protein